MLVEDIMKTDLITLHPEDTLCHALQKAEKHRIRHLPVVNADRQLIGLISDRDLRDARPSLFEPQQDAIDVLNKPVSAIMKTRVLTCHPRDFVEDAARILYEHRIGCLPVVQQGELVGLVTRSDILHTLVELMGVHQPSSHIEVEVPDLPGSLADVASVFKDCQMNVSSVLVYPGKKANTRRLVFRVRTMDPRKAIALLKEQGHEVIWPRDLVQDVQP